MRKNNFLKIFVSLVMCLALVLSLVACGGSGEKGEKGEDGKDGVDGVGIAAVTYEDGKLVIKYTNDKTDSFDLVIEGATAEVCAHANFSEAVELVDHKMNEDGTFVDGTYLTVCGDCGYGKIAKDVIHANEAVVKAPTCTATGYTADECTVCGLVGEKTNETAIVPHTWTDVNYTAADIESGVVCDGSEEGYTVFQHCKYCDATQTATKTEGIGHAVASWTEFKAPTVVNAGILAGTCQRCGTDVKNDELLPALNTTDYNYTLTESDDCSKASVGTYVIVVNGQEFKYEENISAVGHTLNGKPAENFVIGKTAAGLDIFAYSDKIQVVAGQEVKCGEKEVQGLFTCEKCAKPVLVMTAQYHSGVATTGGVKVNPGCTTPGYVEIDKCDLCGLVSTTTEKIYQTLPAVGHSVLVTYDYDEETGVFASITGGCTATDCTEGQINVTNRVGSVSVIKAATCTAEGRVTLTYANDDATAFLTADSITAKIPHTLNGKLASEFEDKFVDDVTGDVITVYSYNIPNISEVDDKTDAEEYSCGDYTVTKSGMYTCEVCKSPALVDLYMPHTGTWTITPAQGENECDELVTWTVACTSGDKCSKKFTEAKKPGLDHKYEYDFVVGTPAAQGEKAPASLVAKCEYCELPKTIDLGTEYDITEVAATCTSAAKTVYTYKDATGAVKTHEVVTGAALPHKLNGVNAATLADKKADGSLVYDISTPGINVFADGSELVCGNKESTTSGLYNCSDCKQAVLVDVYKGHVGNWVVTKEANCEVDGVLSILKCDDCGAAGTKAIAAKGHTYATTVIATSKTSVTLECVDCVFTGDNACNCVEGKKTVTLIPDEAKTNIVTEPTCAVDGLKTYKWTLTVGEQKINVTYNEITESYTVDHKFGSEDKAPAYYIFQIEDEYVAYKECSCCGAVELWTEFEANADKAALVAEIEAWIEENYAD